MPKSAKTSPLLVVSGLHIRRGATHILRGIDWQVNRGEHWAVLGPNGCGKTSLLSALMAYLPPSEGSIELLGESYGETDWRDMRYRIGMVTNVLARRVPPEEPAIETVLSGTHAQLGYWSRERNPPTAKALRCLGKLKVRSLAQRSFGVLSQGERQKVFIARALMTDPELLILDEPCAGLDPVAREYFLRNLQRLSRQKRSPGLLLVTHHVEEIFPGITHVLLLKKGRVFAAGPKERVLRSSFLTEVFGTALRVRKNAKTETYALSLCR